jgi:hypothetical protein
LILKRTLIAISSLLVVASLSSRNESAEAQTNTAETGSRYVGLRHGPNLPRGLVDKGGGLITDPYKDKIQFGMSQVSRGATNMVWFELLTHHDSEGKAYWEVLDVVTTPPLRRKQLVMLTLCLFNDNPDPEIAAVVEPLPRHNYETRIIKAWRANRQTRKFEAIPLTGVKCEMQGDD